MCLSSIVGHFLCLKDRAYSFFVSHVEADCFAGHESSFLSQSARHHVQLIHGYKPVAHAEQRWVKTVETQRLHVIEPQKGAAVEAQAVIVAVVPSGRRQVLIDIRIEVPVVVQYVVERLVVHRRQQLCLGWCPVGVGDVERPFFFLSGCEPVAECLPRQQQPFVGKRA